MTCFEVDSSATACLLLAIASMVALAATAATAQGPSVTPANGRAGSKSISVSGSAWNPIKLAVSRGARVVWRNPTAVDHNVVAYGGNWSFTRILPEGQSVSYVFQNAGTFLFRCTLHSYVSGGVCHGMCGRVIVRS